ncbi:MAG: hypothetical protein H6696_19265 [Deferribacteres bacterium]|nr:hypothetical protein [candidate division KSB1 bacterium]MCB9504070.1 hypothetical protein [Deferribacteres bacterium]
MQNKPLYIGTAKLNADKKTVKGEFVTVDGEQYYKISNYDHMDPFFMSIVSNSDHWMFIWSNGGLSAGRKNPDNALFPYYTDDKIKDNAELTGSKTILQVDVDEKRYLWEPFSEKYNGLYHTERNCYKNTIGNKIRFEEINHDLGLSFCYTWMNSSKYGFIKKSQLKNFDQKTRSLALLDGLQNLLCPSIGQRFQNEYSTLVDGYKKGELEKEYKLGLYALSSIPVDKAEPSESLRATSVWSTGIEPEAILLSSRQLENFRRGESISEEVDIRAARCAYFVHAAFDLLPEEEKQFYFVAEVNQTLVNIASIKSLLANETRVSTLLEADCAAGTENLRKIVASADGLQKTADQLTTTRHFSNTLFNLMRGGIFDDGYRIKKSDFMKFCRTANKPLVKNNEKFFEDIPETLDLQELLQKVRKKDDISLRKLCYEYLPLTFSRRHGDPSRPWNQFSINIQDEHGNKILDYQGNWRDIFQNWEALALAYPTYIESMITKFVNASTADGYNPYRVVRDGFDWEIIDPYDAWSYIGYWGDHQIIYLLKLLELSEKYHPQVLQRMLLEEHFAYAHVPYKIKPYQEIVKDPQNTVDFDHELQNHIDARVKKIGADGKFLWDEKNNKIVHVNLTEKILVPILSKLSNFIPEAGIWMNTQRPEWNDANNALVGFGVSMVTLYYLRRHLQFCQNLFEKMDNRNVEISLEVADFFQAVSKIFQENSEQLTKSLTEKDRKQILDLLGNAGEKFRNTFYNRGFSGHKNKIDFSELAAFCRNALSIIDHSIRANERNDHMFHAYNLISITDEAVSIRHLYEMLEGQVAILSSGYLSAEQSLQLLHALRASALYRADQDSYILYPNRNLQRFTEKNNIPSEDFRKSRLQQKLVQQGDRRIIIEDENGGVHFNADFRNTRILAEALDALGDEFKSLVGKEKQLILDTYEALFDHQSFTGRSGTFFKYEGLGSIYWHMVSKLLLAVQETLINALQQGDETAVVDELESHYYEIRNGIGVTKSPAQYGGFPTDPYSHTPAHAGGQQPGMTGQVKEDILSRFGELGVKVINGIFRFCPALLKKDEYLKRDENFTYYDVHGKKITIHLPMGSLAFTIAQTPIVYHLSNEEKLVIKNADGNSKQSESLMLTESESSSIFNRSGEIQQIDVYLDEKK